MKIRKIEKDIETCIQRFCQAEKAIKAWMKSGGKEKMMIFTFLNLKGNTEIGLKPHPFEKSYIYEKVKGKTVVTEKPYTAEEKKAWISCFGKPLVIPKNIGNGITYKEFLDQIEERKKLMQESIAFTSQSRFRNYIPTKKKGK